MTELILASSSPYRRDLLARLGLPFACDSPRVDETAQPGEAPAELARRLAQAKAAAVAALYPAAVVIGSDQVASLDGQPIGKPNSEDAARRQLQAASGRPVTFYTGLCVIDGRSGRCQTQVELFTVHFRALSAAAIERYVAREQPLDCAGSFRVEGLGIALFKRLEGEDPNSLIGLPLIRLVGMLNNLGIDVI